MLDVYLLPLFYFFCGLHVLVFEVVPNFGPLVLTVGLVIVLSLTGERLRRREGALLVAVALGRWVIPLL